MGNSLGGRKTAKVMKINGDMIKFKTPANVGEILKDYPRNVLLESEAVERFGIRAKPLEPQQDLKSKRLYFLVELPEFPQDKVVRKVRSGIHMSAKDRLESLMLAKRSISDVSVMKPPSTAIAFGELVKSSENGTMRLKMRLPKAEMEKLMMESKDGTEIAEKILNLYNVGCGEHRDTKKVRHVHVQWKNASGNVSGRLKSREKHIGFL